MRVYLDSSVNTIEVGICYFPDEKEIGVKIWKWIMIISFGENLPKSDKKPRFSRKRYETSVKDLQSVLVSLQNKSPSSQHEVWGKSMEQSEQITKPLNVSDTLADSENSDTF